MILCTQVTLVTGFTKMKPSSTLQQTQKPESAPSTQTSTTKKPSRNPQPYRAHQKNPNQSNTSFCFHIHRLRQTRKIPTSEDYAPSQAHIRSRSHQTRQRSPNHHLRPHIRLQSPNLPPSQHSRSKKLTRRNLRLHPKTKDKPKRTRNTRRRKQKQILPLHKRLHKRHAPNTTKIKGASKHLQRRLRRPNQRLILIRISHKRHDN